MKKPNIRSRRVVLPAVALAAALGIGGTVWTATANDGPGTERDRVGRTATEGVGGTVIHVDTSDDPGEAYEVELRAEDGTEREVALDAQMRVVSERADDDNDDNDGSDDSDGRMLGAAERTAAEQAALDAAGGGTVLEAESGGDRGEAYEVEVRDPDGTEWDVELDAGYEVLRKSVDD
jgi:uncharacterized membrane protein YkoI